jgi:hypothetical protein
MSGYGIHETGRRDDNDPGCAVYFCTIAGAVIGLLGGSSDGIGGAISGLIMGLVIGFICGCVLSVKWE